MNFTNGVWAVEYARGFIPLSMPFGIAEEILVCQDFLTATQTLSLYTDLVAQALGHKYARLRPLTAGMSRLAYQVTRSLMPSPEVSEIPSKNIHWFQRKT
jgi:hypothetical protein